MKEKKFSFVGHYLKFGIVGVALLCVGLFVPQYAVVFEIGAILVIMSVLGMVISTYEEART